MLQSTSYWEFILQEAQCWGDRYWESGETMLADIPKSFNENDDIAPVVSVCTPISLVKE